MPAFKRELFSLLFVFWYPIGVFAFQEFGCDSVAGCDGTPVQCDSAPNPSGNTSSFGVTGDWFGLRGSLKDRGITFDGDITQFYQGVAHGGRREAFNYAGHGDYLVNYDLGKLFQLHDWSLMTRTEHRWGESASRDAGLLFPPALHAITPTPVTEELLLTNVLFTKKVNQNLTTFFGKMDTLDGDRNPFASGRGKSQFMNTNLLLPVGGIPTVPLATLGAGAVLFVEGLPLGQFVILNASDTVSTTGIDELFNDGVFMLGSVNLPLPLAGKLGIHTFSAGWSSKDFTSFGQDARVILPSIPLQRTEDSWVAWWSGAQYLVEDPDHPLEGWGLFGRAGAADPEANPVAYFFNAGIGGQSPFSCRTNDRFGLGWFYNRYSEQIGPLLTAALALEESSTGVEAYYNYAATPNLHVTPDLQVVEPGSNRANTALIVGLRAELDF